MQEERGAGSGGKQIGEMSEINNEGSLMGQRPAPEALAEGERLWFPLLDVFQEQTLCQIPVKLKLSIFK